MGEEYNREAPDKIKDLEYQLEQQKIMNPISVDMIATISDLSKKLMVACDALEFYANISNWNGTYDNMCIDEGKRAEAALKLIKGE